MNTPKQPPERRFFEPVFVARQPILDRESRVYGFELLFRQAVSAMAAQVADADTATARVIIDGFPLVAETMLGPRKCFINFPEGLLLKQIPLALPREMCVVEILEDVRPRPEVLDACRDIKHAGYLLAVDDFVGQPELVPFVEMADIVKVDVLGLTPGQVREIAGPLLGRQTALLAEKVEDGEAYRACLDAGFTYFQGYHFSRPEVVCGRKPPVGVVSKVRLLRELAVPDPEPERIAAILSSDAGLSFRLLKYLNSAAFFRMDKVASLSQAMLVMGQNPLRKWLMAVLLTEMAHTPIGREVSFQSLSRARFLELLAQGRARLAFRPDSLFMLGLFSRMDALLGQSMAEVAAQLPLEEDILAALRGEPGQAGKLLELAGDIEGGRFEKALDVLSRTGVAAADAAKIHAEATLWARDVLG
ncbi:putative signal transduction protein [hydrocarbon metagenome]|uniref:Putative signal transduction protein n=1 Tax=hydrocarbon metagenome TaxID=938273 RepID=A0A0W8G899_9ZZZZ